MHLPSARLRACYDPTNDSRFTQRNRENAPTNSRGEPENAHNQTAVTYTYDPNCVANHNNCDLPQSITDSEGRTVGFQRDALDRITAVTYPDGTSDVYAYTRLDLSGNSQKILDVTKYTDRLGRITKYSYDQERRVTDITDPMNRTIVFEYYGGILRELTDQNGHVTTWTHDVQGRPLTKTYDGHATPDVSYTYDEAGRLKTVTNATGQVKILEYFGDNTIGFVHYENVSAPNISIGGSVSLHYDPYFRRLTDMYDDLGHTTWTYVPAATDGALAVATEDGPFANDEVTYGYDELGRVNSLTVGDTPTERWSRDAIGRVSEHVTALGTFNYDYLGETDAPTARGLAGSSISTVWSYDTNQNDRRLVGIFNNNDGMSWPRSFQLDWPHPTFPGSPYQVGSIERFNGGRDHERWCNQYDASGRLTQVSAPPTPSGDCSQTQTTLYAYGADPAGNLTSFTPVGGPSAAVTATYNNLNQIVTWGSQNISYDGNGNQLSELATDPNAAASVQWDPENRVTAIVTAQGTTTFGYDGLGRLLQVAHPTGEPVRFTWCGSKRCQRRSGDTTVVRHFAEGELRPTQAQLIPLSVSGAMAFLTYNDRLITMTDHLGNVASVVDAATGAVVGGADFTPYGQVSSGTVVTDTPYAGLYYDGTLGLYYSNTRVYDPTTGRWLSRDTIGFAGGDANLYAYVFNDPVNLIDPIGTIVPVMLGGAVGGAVIGGTIGAAMGGIKAAAAGGDWSDIGAGALSGAGSGAAFGALAGIGAAIPSAASVYIAGPGVVGAGMQFALGFSAAVLSPKLPGLASVVGTTLLKDVLNPQKASGEENDQLCR